MLFYIVLFAAVFGAMALGAPTGVVAIVGCAVAVPVGWFLSRRTDREAPPAPRRPGPAAQDWVLLAISAVFCLAGLLMMRSNWRLAVMTLTFCGGCGAVAISILLRKRREQCFAESVGEVRIVGGVDLHPSRGRGYGLGIGLLAGGLVLALVDPSAPWLLRACGAFIALVGLFVIFRVATGRHARYSLRFEPEGLVFGHRRYQVQVPWDAVATVAVFEFADNAFVGLGLHEPERLAVTPAEEALRFAKDVQHTRRSFGFELTLMTAHFGFDAPPLAAALQRYASDPDARAELGRRLPAPAG